MRAERTRPVLLAFALLLAGALHLALTDEHLRSSALLGTGFIVAGLAQLALGLIVAVRPAMAPYGAAVALNAVLIVLYLMHLTTGLPLPDAAAGSDELQGVLGPRESVELPAVITKLVEVTGIALALLVRRDRAVIEQVAMRRAA